MLKMEEWDLYDENKNITGKIHIRGNQIPDDFYHLVVHVWIKNNEGKFLISQRSENRPTFPLMWECVGGSVLKGEDSLQGAKRETMEEVGINLSNIDGDLVYNKVRKRFKDIMEVWLFQYNGEIDLKKATTDEVKDFKWMTKEQIKQLYKDKQLVQTLDYFLNEIDI